MPSIKPLSAVPRGKIVVYLASLGMPENVIEWKYFDAAFNEGRERGFAAVKDGDVMGFIGVIPVRVKENGEIRFSNWACDWSVSRQLPGIYGLLLLDAATEHFGSLVAFGGTDVTQKILSRLAAARDQNAGVVFRKHLTLEPFVAWFERRYAISAGPFGRLIRKIPIPSSQSLRSFRSPVIATQGLPDGDFALPVDESIRQPTVVHDRRSLEWRLIRCPGIETWTFSAAHNEAVVLSWRARNTPGKWKLALFVQSDREIALLACISQAMYQLKQRGGSTVIAIVSRLNATSVAALQSIGFSRMELRYPLQVTSAQSYGDSLEKLSGLSNLDADIFYRF